MITEEKKNILVFYSNTNSHGKKDATGAFIPEAKRFAKIHNVPKEHMVGIKCPRVPKFKRRVQVYSALRTMSGNFLDAIVFFGHGWPSGIQFGISKNNINDLVEFMSTCCKKDVKILLYACLAAENQVRDKNRKNLGPATDGGFADELRDEMARQEMNEGWVDAHKTAGHTSWNPFVVRFLGESVTESIKGATGGAWIIAPGSQLWRKWIKALSVKGGLRLRFPFMTEMEIRQELTA